MKLLILFNLFFVGFSTMNDSQSNNDILLYENYTQANIKLQKENFLNINIYFNDIVFVNKEILLQQGQQRHNIDGVLFDVICNLEIINQWNIYNSPSVRAQNPYSSVYKKFVEERKQILKLFYLGRLRLSQIFDSFLILADEEMDEYNIIKNIYLINVLNDVIISITRVCSFNCFDGEYNYIFTKKVEDGVFILSNKSHSNVILPEELKTDYHDDETDVKFTFDKTGMLKKL